MVANGAADVHAQPLLPPIVTLLSAVHIDIGAKLAIVAPVLTRAKADKQPDQILHRMVAVKHNNTVTIGQCPRAAPVVDTSPSPEASSAAGAVSISCASTASCVVAFAACFLAAAVTAASSASPSLPCRSGEVFAGTDQGDD